MTVRRSEAVAADWWSVDYAGSARAASILACAWVLMSAVCSDAHVRSRSHSSWSIHDSAVQMTYSVPLLEVTRLGNADGTHAGLSRLLVDHMESRVAVATGGEPCRSEGPPRELSARKDFARARWSWQCSTSAAIDLTIGTFFDVAPGHLHYASVHVGDDDSGEVLFTAAAHHHRVTLPGTQTGMATRVGILDYLALGTTHILAGVDHLAFLLALLLMCGRLREVVLMVTGFTAGHSLTLSLAALGVVEPDVPVIEAMIGFTIALVAIDNVGSTTGRSRSIAAVVGVGMIALIALRVATPLGLPLPALVGMTLFAVCYLPLSATPRTTARLRPLLTVVFGLIHGFGFAAVLLDAGLAEGRMLAALFGFNLGVELGQVALVALIWATARIVLARLRATDRQLGFEVANGALCGLGLFWFIGRALA